MANNSLKHTMGWWILGLTFFWSGACTKTDDLIRTNNAAGAINSAANLVATLEPDLPSDAPRSVLSVGLCNIEVLNGQAPTQKPLAIQSNSHLRLEGWVADESNLKRTPEQLFIVLQEVISGSRWNAKVSSRVPRPDVVRAVGSSLQSGFRTGVDTSKAPKGEYRVLVAFWQDGPLKVCDVGRRVLIE